MKNDTKNKLWFDWAESLWSQSAYLLMIEDPALHAAAALLHGNHHHRVPLRQRRPHTTAGVRNSSRHNGALMRTTSTAGSLLCGGTTATARAGRRFVESTVFCSLVGCDRVVAGNVRIVGWFWQIRANYPWKMIPLLIFSSISRKFNDSLLHIIIKQFIRIHCTMHTLPTDFLCFQGCSWFDLLDLGDQITSCSSNVSYLP